MLPIAGFLLPFSSSVPAMLDLRPRELALAAAIVFVLTSWFIDRQILYAMIESLRTIW
jgi:hypothetical protein